MKKALPYILYTLVILAAGGLLIYQGLVEKSLDSSDLSKGILVIAGALLGMLRPKRRRKVSNRKAVYQKAYAEFIQSAFSDEPKLENKFYKAVEDYNFDRYGAAIDKLNKLRKECQRTADLYAVIVFTALCYDGMGAYEDAITQYRSAAAIRDNSTLHSNEGLCYTRMGRFDEAEEAFHKAIKVDPKNAFAWNNLASVYFRQGEYYDALEFAENAIAIDSQMPQALSCAAICCALLENEEDYRKYYRQAVAAGYDGNRIKKFISDLKI